jgi:2-deoxy-D-gluconate 3-dehydrogenase
VVALAIVSGIVYALANLDPEGVQAAADDPCARCTESAPAVGVDMPADLFRRVIDVNLTGLFLSRNDASKHGLWGFTKNIALEPAPHGILVNAIAPGGILTPGVTAGDVPSEALKGFAALIPMGRMGDPDDIARAALFLASDLASYMTGSQIVVDGGRLLG